MCELDCVEKKIQISVENDFTNERLDVFIVQVCSLIPSRSFAAKWIVHAKVSVDGRVEKPSFRVSTGQQIEIDVSFALEMTAVPQGEKIPLSILYEDSYVLVINKPSGLVVHPGAGVRSGTLVNAIIAHCGSTLPSLGAPSRAGIVHRLDRETSGVMVVAKTQLALTHLAKQFAAHQQKKVYQAVVYGVPEKKSGKIETWHGRDPRDRIKFSVQKEGVGKNAVMSYVVTEEFAHQSCALVECHLQTGRTHQIRVQLNSIGHPVVGDKLYHDVPHGIRERKRLLALAKQYVERQLLHASDLEFIHPYENKPMLFHAPLPKEFQHFFEILKENFPYVAP